MKMTLGFAAGCAAAVAYSSEKVRSRAIRALARRLEFMVR